MRAEARNHDVAGSVWRRRDRFDAFQRRHRVLGFPIAVLYKFFDDQGVYLAALITYYGFLSLFPLLLLLASIVGFVLQGNTDLQRRILESTLSQFPIIGDQLQDPQGLQGSVAAVVVGLLIAIYGGLGVAQATQHAMNTAWAVSRNRRPNPLRGRLRSLMLLSTGGVLVLATTILAGLASTTETFGANLGTGFKIIITVTGIGVNALIFVVGFRITTAIRLSVRQVFVGALVNAVCWYLLQVFGAASVGSLRGVSTTYGVFSLVFGLLAWIFVAAIVLVICVEINVVRTKQLYPRALMTPFTDNVDLTDADQRIYSEAVGAQRLKGFEVVDVHFRHDGQYASAQRAAAMDSTGERSGPLARPGGSGSTEQVEVVAADGTVERVVSRAEMRSGTLRHRVAMVAILHPGRNEILVHQRADWKDIWPSRWDLAFGGVVGVGESWEDAAVRELSEETGLAIEPGDLVSLGPASVYDDNDVSELSRAWFVRSDGPFSFVDHEVQRTRWLPLGELDAWIAEHSVCPDTVALLFPHLRELNG